MLFSKNVLHEQTSDYGRYRVVDHVYDGREARVLYGTHNSPQSGVARDDDPELLFNYNQRFLEIVQSVQPKSILIIGGGAFTFPTALFNHFPDLEIDVVEIDPILPAIARDYFNLPIDNRMNVITGDGREFVTNTNKSYDVIILDAFSDYTIPYHLITVEAAKQYAHRLNHNGIMAINFIAAYDAKKRSLTYELRAVFQEAFPLVEIYPTDPYNHTAQEQNLVLVASKQPEMPRLDYLQSTNLNLPDMQGDLVLRDSQT